MKNITIQEPCSENWNEMTPTEKGAFCQKCATQVIDFTDKSNLEIKTIFRSLIGQSICSKITPNQLESLNNEFELWQMNSKRSIQSMLLFSLIVVFGLSLFSCETEHEKKAILKIQAVVGQKIHASENEKSNENQLIVHQPAIEPVTLMNQSDDLILDYEDTVNHVLDEVVLVEDYLTLELRESYVLGAMVSRTRYDEYIIKTIPEETIEMDENQVPIPKTFSAKAFPNPVISTTTLEIAIPQNDHFEIHLFDLSGKNIQTIFQGELNKGTHRYPIEMENLPVGVYIFTIHSGKFSESIRVVKQ